jgi:chromatin remodeling complex protein RSC6
MPRKSTKNTTQVNEEKKVTVAPVPSPVAPVPSPVAKQPVAQVQSVNSNVESEMPSVVVDDSKKSVHRHAPTSESVEKEFDELIMGLDEEIRKLRDSNSKSKGVKFLRTLNKKLKVLKNHTLRVSKKKTTTRRNNTNSGFLKPVHISKELAKFTGWEQTELRSRVDVTKYICNYIKEKNLQDPTDKRNIRVDDDINLKKLLKFDGKDKKPLTYYRLQTYLKGHFSPSPAVEAK